MKRCLFLGAFLLAGLRTTVGAEIPFDEPDEFPAQAYEFLAEKRVIWFGEMHGTREAPELFLGLVRLVSRQDRTPPVVALEIPTTEQAAIDRYLASGDEAILRSTGLFKSQIKDGRSSVAMQRLLSRLRSEKKAAVTCFDSATAQSPQERDTAMAQNLTRCARKYPDAKLIVLSGNIHARMVEGASWDPAYRPAAFELAKQVGPVVSFVLAYESGTIWALTDEGFGEQKVKGRPWRGTSQHAITLYPQRRDGHDGAILARTLTGSPPW